MRAIKVSTPVRTFLQNAYFAPYYVRTAAQRLITDYDVYKDLYIDSVDIYNINGNTVFNIYVSRYYNLPPIHKLVMFGTNFSLNDYDFRCLRNYFKSLSTYGNH